MATVRTSPPAKLNLFLEIPARREDGFHEIDTVMTAIDWRDELEIESIPEPIVQLTAAWIPSVEQVAEELGLRHQHGEVPSMLRLPTDGSNLVVKALELFRSSFAIKTGFRVTLRKRIPAAAGMGGASSDAAHAIACAAQIHQIDSESNSLHQIAASVGSDVPFFLPSFHSDGSAVTTTHATGRGEMLSPIHTGTSIDFVVAYPAAGLSTAAVYRKLRVPSKPQTSAAFRSALEAGDRDSMSELMMNRLSEPALEILPQLRDLRDSLWQSDEQTCQLTGSGSAMFAVMRDADHAQEVVNRLRIQLTPGVLLRVARTVPAAAHIETVPS